MLAVADRQQGFFDAVWCSDLLPEGSIYSLLAEHGDRIVRDEDFADCYSERRGRPSIPPSLLAKVLLLAFREGLSDERAMDAVRFDLRWKVALDLPVDHPGFHPTSLVRFRARLLLHGKERLVFERSLELATELGLLSGPAEQILDWRDKAAREALLAEVARDAGRALRAVEEGDELAADAAIAEAAKLLREIVGQEFELADEELPRPRGGRRSRQILSAEDPDMRHARSSAARPFTGYKIHAAAATEAPLLTSIALSPGNEHDGHHAGTLVDQQPEQRRPTRVIGDTAYGNIEVREELERRSVSVLAPVHSTSPKNGTIPKDAFEIDLEADTVTCPQGNTRPIYKPRRNRRSDTGVRVAQFLESDCEPCPLGERCAPTGGRRIRITRREDLRQAGLRALADPSEREHLKRTRPRIERLLGLIVHRYQGRRSRYLGSRKSEFQALWTAVLVNLHPIGGALRAQAA